MFVSRRLHADLIFFSFFFSILFCIFCSLVDNLVSFWVFLELCSLSIIPSFFCVGDSNVGGFYNSLLTYIVVSGLSSVFVVVGILFIDLYSFILFGFILKFGLFPFSLWVYCVFSSSNWFFIFFLSVILKFPVLFFSFLFQNVSLYIIYCDCALTILWCTIFFWFFSFNWVFIWCHMSISSVSTLLVACFCSNIDLCFFIYGYYFFWSVGCMLYFYYMVDVAGGYIIKFWVYCFLLLVTPISLPLFYKLSVCLAIFYSSVYVLFIWSLYSFSEQFFLYKLASDYFYSDVYNCWVV
uniref:NADH dehydrogenase subunit 2 n=1 Tax=Hymenolepis microstoma TaxID=85433 RepID=A0A1E1GI20_HYMMI|nr:NADH dehydrogenase subunit 2 [Hymenolepis microstoma]BBB87190.1 NADH dehydrogenase subunit 2 [Hymenolepis microstoma]